MRVGQLITPTDLANEFSKFEGAAEFFNIINNLSKRNALHWIKLAKAKKIRD